MTSTVPEQHEALKERYERERTIRQGGTRGQYEDLVGQSAHFADDPHTPPITRSPLKDAVDVAIIGGGFGGLVAGARLREAGVEHIRVIDNAGDFGGTWYWNRYPGIACDIEASIYLPLLEEMNYVPKHRYAYGPEILAYAQSIGVKYSLYDKALFQTTLAEMKWDEALAQWRLRTNRDDDITARFVILSPGFLHTPMVSAIPGVNRFQNKSFHSSRWDYSYTGGSSDGDLTGLADKVVGIVGTGATAIQIIPKVAQSAKQLYVFQRTPSVVAVRDQRPTDANWAKSLTPGWQSDRMRNFTGHLSGELAAEDDLVNDSWTEIFGTLAVGKPPFHELAPEQIPAAREAADLEEMAKIRARIDSIVDDEDVAEHLKPYYYFFCKRPCFHDEYLAAFNRTNVELVHAPGGVESVTETGLIANGITYELDCLVFSTGFDSYFAPYTDRAGVDPVGRDGLTLSTKWADGIATLFGMMTGGFPNMFLMPVPFFQSALVPNHMHAVVEHAGLIAWIVGQLRDRDVDFFDVTPEAEAEWVEAVLRSRGFDIPGVEEATLQFLDACTPGYVNNQGQMRETSSANASYARPLEYFDTLAKWRNDGQMTGLRLVQQ